MSHLSPDRHPQKDFFVADIFDAVPKSDMASMEHPIFALKPGDKRIRHYQHNGVSIEIQPGAKGLATIHDKDIWIFCISQLVAAMNDDIEVSRTIRFTAHDFLTTTNRSTSGRGYKLMAEALNRLRGTTIETNIETAEYREKGGFGLIDSWRVIEKYKDRMVAIEVELPKWLFRAVQASQVLTLSRDYFRLRKPLDRRVYELARKHCGHQPSWRVSLKILHGKSGSTASLREFRRSIKSLAISNQLPDYHMSFDERSDYVTFHNKTEKKAPKLRIRAQSGQDIKSAIDDILNIDW